MKLTLVTRVGVESERIVDLGARRTTDALVNEWVKSRIDPAAARLEQSGTPRAAAEKALRDQLVRDEYLPAVVDARLGDDGSVWLRPYASDQWVVVAPNGAIAYRVDVPGAVRIHQVSLGNMWGVFADADGLPVVVRYRVGAGR